MIIYVPKSVKIGSNVPTMAWFHGGSFRAGSATGPGLDGSKLAVATNSIVAVIQYRLGAVSVIKLERIYAILMVHIARVPWSQRSDQLGH